MLDSFRRRLEQLRDQPVGRRQPIRALLRFIKAEIINTWLGCPFLATHEFGVVLIVEKGHHGTRGHYFFGVLEFEDELFAIDFLRKEELFLDIGANLGMFSVMVAATTGARVIAVEPSPSSSRVFKQHIALNELTDRITLIEACAGDGNGGAFINDTVDSTNFVVFEGADLQPGMAKIPMIRIDDVIDGTIPCLMKMDVEGFEMQALQGATKLLDNQGLQAITVEIADLSCRYGVSPEETHRFITGFGFTAVTYDPLTRVLTPAQSWKRSTTTSLSNTIYVRNVEEARRRLSSAPHRSLHTLAI
jgi:FkbM family methyltransferase